MLYEVITQFVDQFKFFIQSNGSGNTADGLCLQFGADVGKRLPALDFFVERGGVIKLVGQQGLLCMEFGFVITSYSIHYTKLYDDLLSKSIRKRKIWWFCLIFCNFYNNKTHKIPV